MANRPKSYSPHSARKRLQWALVMRFVFTKNPSRTLAYKERVTIQTSPSFVGAVFTVSTKPSSVLAPIFLPGLAGLVRLVRMEPWDMCLNK